MPRTRTKYIWPPPGLANESTTPSPGDVARAAIEPQTKKRRIEAPSTTPVTKAKRVSPVGGGCSSTIIDSGLDSEIVKNIPPAAHAILRKPMEVQVQHYREWRRLGSSHDDYCMICEQSTSQSIFPCTTCSKSFHEGCFPQGSIHDEHHRWFCLVCVLRKWHVQAPTITPPDSPSLSSATVLERSRSSADNSMAQGNTDRQNSTRGEDPKSTGSQALSILAEISRSMSHGESTHSHLLSQSHHAPAAYSPNHLNSTTSFPGQHVPPSIASPYPNDTGTSNCSSASPAAQGLSIMDSHARKSKFATLSTEVDSALWVLYRELESVTSLRQRIGELEAEIVKLRQDVSIRDNQIILSRRSLPSTSSLPGGITQAEIDRLRVQATRGEEASREIKSLHAKNQDLEKDLKEARDECAAKDRTLNEWKNRLVSMIGT